MACSRKARVEGQVSDRSAIAIIATILGTFHTEFFRYLMLMKRFLFGCATCLMATAAIATPVVEQKPKRIYVSAKSTGMLAQCLAAKLRWFAPPAMAAAADGDMRIQFSTGGIVTTDLNILHGAQTQLEVRGVSGGRVKRTIERCL